jgi:hypothetical protein
VVASVLDAATEGGWLYESREGKTSATGARTERRPNAFVRERANVYRRGVESAWRAYDAHGGPKVLVRYEDLRANTLDEMGRIYSALGIAVEDGELRRAVEKHSWENVPDLLGFLLSPEPLIRTLLPLPLAWHLPTDKEALYSLQK